VTKYNSAFSNTPALSHRQRKKQFVSPRVYFSTAVLRSSFTCFEGKWSLLRQLTVH